MEDAGDGAFMRELLELLDSTDATQPPADHFLPTELLTHVVTPVPPPIRPAAPKAASAKRRLEDLRSEVSVLTDQLERLRERLHAAHGADIVTAKERVLGERRKRLRAEEDCCKLREDVYAQRNFIRRLRSVFSETPRFALGLDLCRYLHRHTHLARNRNLRWGEFDMNTVDSRMRSAMNILCHETESLSLSDDPRDQTQRPGQTLFLNGVIMDSNDCHADTSMAVYTVDSSDLNAVVRATCVAVRDIATACGLGHPLHVSHDIIDVDAFPASNILYRVLAVRHPNATTGEELTFETHAVTSYKITNDYAVVLWDFVDVDELYPPHDTTNIAREVTGACLIRREWCGDGVERTVFRSLTTKKFRFLNQESASRLRQFACITCPTAQVHFRRILIDQVAAEKALDVQH